MPYPKIISSSHYHVWSDALHGRQLAQQAANRWDRGTYVRWTVVSAWTTLEMVCEHALSATGIGRRFRENLDAAVAAAGLSPLDWGSGVWQRVSTLQVTRKKFVHLNVQQELLFPEIAEADNALQIVRDAITTLCRHASKNPPPWLADDADPGWAGKGGIRATAHMTAMRAGIDPNAPDTIKISYIYKDREHESEWLLPDADVEAAIADLLSRMNVPISAVRVYRGGNLIEDRQLQMRGA